MPVVPATQEAEAGRWLEPRSSKPTWSTPFKILILIIKFNLKIKIGIKKAEKYSTLC